MVAEFFSHAMIVFGVIYLVLYLSMPYMLKRNNRTVGFFDINFRLFKKFRKMMHEEKDSTRKVFYRHVYNITIVSVVLAFFLSLVISIL